MAEFRSSTQAANWQLTPEKIATRRATAQERSLAARDGSHSHDLLSLSEQTTLLKAHAYRLSVLTSQLNMPPKVLCTALTYCSRFYLDHTANDFDPAAITLLALYASTKVEEVVIAADDLCARAAQLPSFAREVPAAVLLASELPFLQALRFHLIVYHPFRSLGILREHLHTARAFRGLPDPPAALAAVMARAERALVRRAYFTDLPLTHPPAALALAALLFAIREGDAAVAEEAIFRAVEGSAGKVADGVKDVARRAADELERVSERVEGEVAESLERRRAAMPVVSNFLTKAFQDDDDAHQLEVVDREEAEREREVRRRNEELAGLSGRLDERGAKRIGDTIEEGVAKKVRLQSM